MIAMEKQIGMPNLRKGVLDLAMNREIEMLQKQVIVLKRENESIKLENQKLKKALEKKNANVIRHL